MDETIDFAIFGGCMVLLGTLLVLIHTKHQWKHSEQRAHEEYWRFRGYMKKLEIDKESVKEVVGKFASIDDIANANNRLKKYFTNEKQLR